MNLKTVITKTLLGEQVTPIDLSESMEVAKKVMSKSGAHIGTVYKYDKPNVLGFTHGASYHPHGPTKGRSPGSEKDWDHHESESDAEKEIHRLHGKYKSDAKRAADKAQKHLDSIPD